MSIKRKISFNEDLHRYTDEDNNEYTSVTSLIKRYEKPFDENYWAKKKADEAGLPTEVVKQNWKDIREYSANKGTIEHKLLEDSINKSNNNQDFKFDSTTYRERSPFKDRIGFIEINSTNLEVLANSPLGRKYPEIYKFLEGFILQGWTLMAEKRVYWYDFLIAGTIDCLLLKGKEFMIVDWKTNKDKLKFESGYYKKIGGVKSDQWVSTNDFFKPPISALSFCKGNIYTLQLSLYSYILELWGFKCVNLFLFHIKSETEIYLHKIIYARWAAQLILIDSKQSSISSSRSNNSNSSSEFGVF